MRATPKSGHNKFIVGKNGFCIKKIIGTKTKFKIQAKNTMEDIFLNPLLLKYSSNISATAYIAGAKKANNIHIKLILT